VSIKLFAANAAIELEMTANKNSSVLMGKSPLPINSKLILKFVK
jgi:hypothetical protein